MMFWKQHYENCFEKSDLNMFPNLFLICYRKDLNANEMTTVDLYIQ